MVLTFCGYDLSHYPWGKVHRHPNMVFGETFPPCITIPGNSREVETQTLEMCPSWPRLNVQGEAKTQFLATNSAETMDVSPTGFGLHPILSCQPEHQTMPDVWANLSFSLVGFVTHQTPEGQTCCQSCCLRAWTDTMGQALTTWREHCLVVLEMVMLFARVQYPLLYCKDVN